MNSARPSRGPAPAASELDAALQDYQRAMQAISRRPFSPARLRLLIEQLAGIGDSTIALPQFAGDFVELTIRHFELVRLLCRPRRAAERVDDEAAVALLCAQCEAVRDMRSRLLAASTARRAVVPPAMT